MIETDTWTDELVQQAGIPIIDVPFVTIGSGIGSFVTFDTLRIYGVPARGDGRSRHPDGAVVAVTST